MRRSIRTSYTHTILASYLGYITQAVVNNRTAFCSLRSVLRWG